MLEALSKFFSVEDTVPIHQYELLPPINESARYFSVETDTSEVQPQIIDLLRKSDINLHELDTFINKYRENALFELKKNENLSYHEKLALMRSYVKDLIPSHWKKSKTRLVIAVAALLLSACSIPPARQTDPTITQPPETQTNPEKQSRLIEDVFQLYIDRGWAKTNEEKSEIEETRVIFKKLEEKLKVLLNINSDQKIVFTLSSIDVTDETSWMANATYQQVIIVGVKTGNEPSENRMTLTSEGAILNEDQLVSYDKIPELATLKEDIRKVLNGLFSFLANFFSGVSISQSGNPYPAFDGDGKQVE